MILEGVVTTLDVDGKIHVTPMGPSIEENFRRLVLRPFQTSRTFANLARTGQGVLHVTDDVELIAHAAVGQLAELPATHRAGVVEGYILSDACRWYGFRVDSIDRRENRAVLACSVVGQGTLREFFGLNRAKHAVVEAAILATRVSLIDADEIDRQMSRLAPLVEKTGGPAEQRAFDFLRRYMADQGERTSG